METAETHHEKGNAAFESDHFEEAVTQYTSAINLDPSRAKSFLNRAMANLKLQRWSEAEEDANTVLELGLKNPKVFYRRALARSLQGNLYHAKEDIRQLTRLDEKTGKQLLDRIEAGYVVAHAPGKGQGAFAIRRFRRGDIILIESPLFLVRTPSPTRAEVQSIVEKLSPEDRERFYSLKNSHAEKAKCDPATGTFLTNTVEYLEGSGIFVEYSRFNHSCSPNAAATIHQGIRILALCDIDIGEEICISYQRTWSKRAIRQKTLEKQWAFKCACKACLLPDPDSDDRRETIGQIWSKYEKSLNFDFQRPREELSEIARAIRLMGEEKLHGESYYFTSIAGSICACHSDWESAKYWMAKTYEARSGECGVDHKETPKYKHWSKRPRNIPVAKRGPKKLNFSDIRLETASVVALGTGRTGQRSRTR